MLVNSTKSVTSIFSPSGLHKISRYSVGTGIFRHWQIDSETAILQAQLDIEGLFSSSTDTATALGLYLLVQNEKKECFKHGEISGSQFGSLKHCHFRRTGKEAELFCDELSKRIDEAFGWGRWAWIRGHLMRSRRLFCAPFLESDFFSLRLIFQESSPGICGRSFVIFSTPGQGE